MTKKITATQLRKLGACKEQVGRFVELFGEEVTVTLRLCVEHAQDFDWGWAAISLLNTATMSEYYKGRGVALVEYSEVDEAAFTEYDRVCVTARTGYDSVRIDAALAEYYKVHAAAKAEYNKACATAFARAYGKREQS